MHLQPEVAARALLAGDDHEEAEEMRELFVEELAQVTGGGLQCPPDCVTTDACCEESRFELCCIVREIRELIEY
jgi:hypothetical protein